MWEFFGGARPDLIKLMREVGPASLDASLRLVSFGPGGLWPHVLALWAVAPGDIDDVLAAGDGEGGDEKGFRWARSRLLRTVKGDLTKRRVAYLVEILRFADSALIQDIDGPDIVLAEAFAPNQAVLLWGAETHEDCVAREKAGWGSARLQTEDRLAWWAVSVAGEGPAYLPTWSADPALLREQ
jgi:hypothetical protein